MFIAHLDLDHSFWRYYNYSLYQSAFFHMAVAGTTAFSFCHRIFRDFYRGSSIFIDGDSFIRIGRSLSLGRLAGAFRTAPRFACRVGRSIAWLDLSHL